MQENWSTGLIRPIAKRVFKNIPTLKPKCTGPLTDKQINEKINVKKIYKPTLFPLRSYAKSVNLVAKM